MNMTASLVVFRKGSAHIQHKVIRIAMILPEKTNPTDKKNGINLVNDGLERFQVSKRRTIRDALLVFGPTGPNSTSFRSAIKSSFTTGSCIIRVVR